MGVSTFLRTMMGSGDLYGKGQWRRRERRRSKRRGG